MAYKSMCVRRNRNFILLQLPNACSSPLLIYFFYKVLIPVYIWDVAAAAPEHPTDVKAMEDVAQVDVIA